MKNKHDKSNVAFLVIFLMLVTLPGFYETYFNKFPAFTGFTPVHHFHGAMMISWFAMLIIQPFLIRYKKFAIHRTVGKLSYIVAPVLLFSIFLAAKGEYNRRLPGSSPEGLAGDIALNLLNLIAFAICYALAIYYRRNRAYHMRYMICTAILMLAPGTIRALLNYSIFHSPTYSMVIGYAYAFSFLVTALLIMNDIRNQRSLKPYLVVAALMMVICFTYFNSRSGLWLAISGKIIAWAY